MNKTTVQKTTKAWADRLGHEKAEAALIVAGLSSRFAEQFIKGKYKHRIFESTLNKLKRAGVFDVDSI